MKNYEKFKIYYFIIIFIIFSFYTNLAGENLGILEEILKPGMIDVFNDELYVIDHTNVYIYSIKNLKLVGKFGKEGEGPGEFKRHYQFPIRISAFRNYLLVETMDKILYFSKKGRFIKEMRKEFGITNVTPLGKNFIVRKLIKSEDRTPDYSVIYLYNSKLKRIKEIYRQKFVEQGRIPNERLNLGQDFINFNVCDGKLFVEKSPRGFIIDVFDCSGNKLYRINKNYKRLKLTSNDKKHLIESFKNDPLIKEQIKRFGGWLELKKFIDFEFPEFYPPIQSLEISNHKLYIKTFFLKENREEFYVMDLKGNVLKRVFIPQFHEPSIMSRLFGKKLSTIDGDKIYYLKENQDENWEFHVTDIK